MLQQYGEFRKALQTMAATENARMRGMGLYSVALAAGQPELGGFAPIAGAAGRLMAQRPRVAALVGEAGFVAAGQGGARVDAVTARQGSGEETSYRVVVARARQQAMARRARREAEAAVLHLPVRGVGLAGVSFAPPPAGGGAAGGGALYPAMPGAVGAPGLRRRNSVHDAVSAAQADSTDNGVGETQEFMADAVLAPVGVVSADIERALEDYFFRQSRLPPVGAAGFNPLLSPVWAGLKIPG